MGGEYTNGPRLRYGRHGHSCAKFQSRLHGNRDVIAVVGGNVYGSNDELKTELWDYTYTNEWEPFEDIPSSTFQSGYSYSWGHPLLPNRNNDGLVMLTDDTIHRFDCSDQEHCSWHELSQPKPRARRSYYPAAFWVSSSVANC